MTAFNDIQLDTEWPYTCNNGGACENHVLDISSSPKALAPALEGKQSYHCCHNKEGCGNYDDDFKWKNSESTVVCCRCMLDCEKLSAALMCKQELLCSLNHELEQERIAAESAAKEAVSMIVRLQVENAALQMEARHYQQVLEAKTLYDEETIGQLKYIISSQEADRMALEKEIIEYREILCKYSQTMSEKVSLLDCTDDLGRVLGLESGDSIRPLSLESKFNHAKVKQVEAAHQVGSPPEAKDEAKTKYVVSISPILDNTRGASVPKGLAATKKWHDGRTWNKEFECFKVGNLTDEGPHMDTIVKECWSSILNQLSILQRQIWKLRVLELPDCEKDLPSFKNQGCTTNREQLSRQQLPGLCTILPCDLLSTDCLANGLERREYLSQDFSTTDPESCLELMSQLADSRQETQISPSSHAISVVEDEGLFSPFKNFVSRAGDNAKAPNQICSWGDTMAVTDICVAALAEKFGACECKLHSLEAARKVITEAMPRMKENKETPEFLLVIAADITEEFLSFTSLGCDILHLLQNLMTLLTKLTKLVEVGDSPGSAGFEAMVKPVDASLDDDDKLLEISVQDKSPSTQEADSKLGKLALLWSSSLEWLSDERCRAETAFSGWDH